MPSGLIQLVSYGSQDLYLTGTPEITFFKIVYRRHTNFSVESIEVSFDDPITFGEESVLTVPKIGDLISNVYLKIILPQLNFKKTPNSSSLIQTALDNWNNSKTYYEYVEDYVNIMVEAYRVATFDNNAENVTTSGEIYTSVEQFFLDGLGYNTEIDNFKNIANNPFNENKANMRTIASNYSVIYPSNNVADKSVLYQNIIKALKQCELIQKYYYYDMMNKEYIYNDTKNDSLQIAWVKKIGHAIIDYVSVSIGGNIIDKQYGDWLNIWTELTCNVNIEHIYNRLIGNVPELVTFDRNTKPQYTLYIPLQFWFCRNYALALPLISLQYHKVSFNVKFRDFKDCVYMEKDKLILYPNYDEQLYLDELGLDEGIYIDATMLIDYIYLDSSERRKFAQSSHEYLIEQVQLRDFTDINLHKFSALIDFDNPCKELIWVAQQIPYTENKDGYTECLWDKYTASEKSIQTTDKVTGIVTTTKEYSDNIVKHSQIDFNGYVRMNRIDGNYTNYVQPYSCHKRTPCDGINLYSFAFNPEQHQPSGQCNLSRISHATIYNEFDKTLFDNAPDKSRVLNLRLYTVNYNILRFVSGMAACAYT